MLAHKMVHFDVSIPHLKSFTKRVGQVRYIVDNEKKIHMAAADECIHGDISREAMISGTFPQLCGYIEWTEKRGFRHWPSYLEENHSTRTWDYTVYHNKEIKDNNPLLARFVNIPRAKRALKFVW